MPVREPDLQIKHDLTTHRRDANEVCHALLLDNLCASRVTIVIVINMVVEVMIFIKIHIHGSAKPLSAFGFHTRTYLGTVDWREAYSRRSRAAKVRIVQRLDPNPWLLRSRKSWPFKLCEQYQNNPAQSHILHRFAIVHSRCSMKHRKL